MANAWFETVAEAQRRAKKRLPKARVRRAGRRLRARADASRTTSPPSPSSASRRTSPGLANERDLGDDGHGPGHVDAGDDQPDRRAGGAPRRRGRRRPRRRGPRRRDGPVARSPASRSRRSSRPTRRRSSRCTGSAPATRCSPGWSAPGAAGAVGLIATLDWSFSYGRDWGSPSSRRRSTSRPGRGTRRRCCSGRAGCSTSRRTGKLPDLTVPNMVATPASRRRRSSARTAVDAVADAVVGGRRLAARAVGRPVHAQGRHARRRRQARGRRRCHRDLGVQPRRQQPRRHAGLDPGAAGGRRRRRRPDRGAARRRHPARRRRRQGARPRARRP